MTIGLEDRILLAKLYISSNKNLFDAMNKFHRERGYPISEPTARKILSNRRILVKGKQGGRRECCGWGALVKEEIAEVLRHHKTYEGDPHLAARESKRHSRFRPGRGYGLNTYIRYWSEHGLEIKRSPNHSGKKGLEDYSFCPPPEMLS